VKPRRERIQPSGAGQPLPAVASAWIGDKLGTDVSGVRLHTDAAAADLATEHDATAVTTGQDIHFAPGAYQPGTPAGLIRLLHETTHAVQQRGSGPADPATSAVQEAEVDTLLASGEVGALTTSGAGALREPTYPRRTTGGALIREAERVLALSRDLTSTDPQTKMWSAVSSNFGAITAGSIARRIWTYIFARHFTESDSRPGVESVHPRYFYSRTYGWVDGQHFFGFIDYAERARSDPDRTRTQAFEAATTRGFDIERQQQQVRDLVMLQRPPANDPVIRLMQVRPPNTPAFRAPVAVAGGITRALAVMRGSMMGGPEGELFRQLDERQQNKMLDDSAKSAWTFEDPTSNQLGIRFFFQHGERINGLPEAAREGEFRNALAAFFSSIGVVEDQSELDMLARSLPGRERYEAPHTTEERERAAHPELYRLP
jgi:hypothetical protein